MEVSVLMKLLVCERSHIIVRVLPWRGRAASRLHWRTVCQIVRSIRTREARRPHQVVLCRIVMLTLARLCQRSESADLFGRLNPARSGASVPSRRPQIVWRPTVLTAETTIGLCRTVSCGVILCLLELECTLM